MFSKSSVEGCAARETGTARTIINHPVFRAPVAAK